MTHVMLFVMWLVMWQQAQQGTIHPVRGGHPIRCTQVCH